MPRRIGELGEQMAVGAQRQRGGVAELGGDVVDGATLGRIDSRDRASAA